MGIESCVCVSAARICAGMSSGPSDSCTIKPAAFRRDLCEEGLQDPCTHRDRRFPGSGAKRTCAGNRRSTVPSLISTWTSRSLIAAVISTRPCPASRRRDDAAIAACEHHSSSPNLLPIKRCKGVEHFLRLRPFGGDDDGRADAGAKRQYAHDRCAADRFTAAAHRDFGDRIARRIERISPWRAHAGPCD